MQILDDWQESNISIEKKNEAAQKIILWLINIFAGIANPIAFCVIFGELDKFMIGVWIFMYNFCGLLVLYAINVVFRACFRLLGRIFIQMKMLQVSRVFFWIQYHTGFLGFATVFNVILLSWAFYWLFKFG